MNPSDLAASIESFGWGLLTVQDAGPARSNVFLSPTGLAFALGLLLNGASGPTRSSISRTLSLRRESLEETNEAFLASLNALTASDPNVRLDIANAVWADGRMTLDGRFIERCQRCLCAKAQTLDFRSSDAVRTINGWVGKHTEGKIPTIVADRDLAPPVEAVLTNAVYFYGPWTHPFVSDNTRVGQFTLGDGTTRRLPMMEQVESFAYAEAEDWQAVRLPYGNGQFFMDILLPKDGASLGELVRAVSEAPERYTLGKARFQTILLVLPRFSLEFQADLAAPLRAMGMSEAFGPMADFSAMGLPAGHFVGAVLHKTLLRVDEQGTEAAAATAVVVVKGGGPRYTAEMRVDRPFLCAIRDRNGMLLFVGAVYEPHAPEPTYEALVGQSGGRTRKAREQEALRTAVHQGDIDAVAVLLGAGANVNAAPARDGGFTPLGEAAFRGDIEMVRFLLGRGADARGCPNGGYSVVMAATLRPHLEIVRLLLDHGAEVDCRLSGGETALTRAALSGETALVTLLAQRGADLEVRNGEGETALLLSLRMASLYGLRRGANTDTAVDTDAAAKTDTAATLLQLGAAPNVQGRNGETPLMLAAQSGQVSIVALMLRHGARLDTADLLGRTVLHRAVSWSTPEIVALLLGAGADVTAKDKQGRDALWLAAQGGHAEVVRLLLEHKADPLSADGSGVAAWAAAAKEGHESTLEVLLEHMPIPNLLEAVKANSLAFVRRALASGADPDQADERGTALMWATRAGEIDEIVVRFYSGGRDLVEQERREARENRTAREIASLLLEQGARADAEMDGVTVLSWAMMRADPEMLALLVDHGARTDGGPMPLVLMAAQRNKPEVLRVLLEHGAEPNPRYFPQVSPDALAEHRELVMDYDGTTPLMWAARQGTRASVELLLAFGADPRIRDTRGRTARDWAIRGSHGDLADLLEI